MSRALYRKYRSKSLDEVVGQTHITNILKRSLDKGIVAHAYLLTGPRGVGKTSIARILAHEINGLEYADESNHLDIIEIDAASNNGVEDVRELRDKVQIAPSVAKKKIYIIDEVHMLSKPAFNALLKTLEEPPEHVVFILATTDIDKLPATIVSRTQRFSFRPITTSDATAHLTMIAEKENIDIDQSALELIARRGQGSFRDSISLLDQISSLNPDGAITAELIAAALGLAPAEMVEQIITAVEKKDVSRVIELIDQAEANGVEDVALVSELAHETKNRLVKNPGLAPLLDRLLEVERASDHYLKLIAVLAGFAMPKPAAKSANLAVSSPSVSSPVESLEIAATLDKPEVMVKPKPIKKTETELPKDKVSRPAEQPVALSEDVNFDWQSLLDHTRQHYLAIYSVLKKCDYSLSGSILTIFTGGAFYKKKLDDSRYRQNLFASIEAICQTKLTIETLPEKAPPRDENAAKIAAIMGGGEEVSVEF